MVIALVVASFGAVVDPHLIVLHDQDGGSRVVEHLTALRQPDIPAPRLSSSILGTHATIVGAVLLAMRDGDTTIVGQPPQRPWLPPGLHFIPTSS